MEPRNICPICYAPFTKGVANAKTEDIETHYWWHKLESISGPGGAKGDRGQEERDG